MKRCGRHLIIALVVISGFSFSLPARAEVVEAQWQVYQIRFLYSGLTTYYACGGIEGKLKRLLLLLGARHDVRVEASCTDIHNLRSPAVRRLQRVQRVKLAFAMPVPADKSDTTREIIPAEWQETKITGNLSRNLDAADCELLEQFQRQVLPQLLVRSDVRNLYCKSNHREFDSMRFTRTLRLRMTALKAIEKTDPEVRPGKTD